MEWDTNIHTRRSVLRTSVATGLGTAALGIGSSRRPGGGPGGGGGRPDSRVTMPNQDSDGSAVTVTVCDMADGGYISIHDVRRFGETPLGNDVPENGVILGSIVGITDFLEPGMHTHVTVDLLGDFVTGVPDDALHDADGLTRSQPLLAIPHRDTENTGPRFREDPAEIGTQLATEEDGDGAYFDGRKMVDSLPVVNDVATVRLDGDDQDSRDEAQAITDQIREGTIVPP